MEHSMYHEGLNTELVIDETLCENTSIEIKDLTNGTATHHFLTPKELRSFIGILLHIQAKKIKDKDFNNLSNTF